MKSIYYFTGYFLSIFWLINGFTINAVNFDNLEFGGKMVTNQNLENYLHNHEKLLLFGKNVKKNKYQLVNVVHHRRSKRSNTNFLNFHLNTTNDGPFTIKLKKINPLIDESFVYIKRYENTSLIVDNYKEMASKLENCFYQSSNSALDVCDGNIKGLLRYKSKVLTIHPLPVRFGKNSHVIIESNEPLVYEGPSSAINCNVNDTVIEPENDVFEPQPNNERTTFNSQAEILNRWQNENGIVQQQRQQQQQQQQEDRRLQYSNDRKKRFISENENVPPATIPQLLHIEAAIFIDRDLYLHMAKNYPKNTESEMIRFVLAMINGVQILYHHPSLGHPINFILKRLEILHTDPKGLRRSSDIDVFLNSFCFWQKKFNPASNDDILHFDHAIILTGLDLYALSKNGKLSSQVVGLAPVGGMCTQTSSCTINEGKHFESVFVVAHEIGHNLGMRHDSLENNCDPNLYVMSPTLGSGKITWSKCSRNYLKEFLKSGQAKCLYNRSKLNIQLDHDADGLLPGERFDADKQCMLKYGVNSVRSKDHPLIEICRDLHCEKDKYTWTTHPSLEGTVCGDEMWCRSGECVTKTQFSQLMTGIRAKLPNESTMKQSEKKLENYLDHHSTVDQFWSNWSIPSECESGCLYGESGRLKDGSTGLQTYRRTCQENSFNIKNCRGLDTKYEACTSKQCYRISRTTVLEFANQICERAQKFDREIIGKGIQYVNDDAEESCKVYCRTKSGIPKAKHWTFPDGTTCNFKDQQQRSEFSYYCVNGRCERFSCNESANNRFKAHSKFCPQNQLIDHHNGDLGTASMFQDQSKIKEQNETTHDSVSHHRRTLKPFPLIIKRSDELHKRWNVQPVNSDAQKHTSKWIAESECYFNCMQNGKGVQTVYSRIDYSSTLKLCDPEMPCNTFETTTSYSRKICQKYQLKVRGLSGNGMQIYANTIDPDRGCKVACQDQHLPYRFYLVTGEQGYFPMGTKCSRTDEQYCLSGKCLKFNSDNVLPHDYRKNISDDYDRGRLKRSVYEQLDDKFIKSLIKNLHLFTLYNETIIDENQIDMTRPIHVNVEDYNIIF